MCVKILMYVFMDFQFYFTGPFFDYPYSKFSFGKI